MVRVRRVAGFCALLYNHSTKVWIQKGDAMEPQVTQQKLRGAFFTPDDVCSFIVHWAIRGKDDTVFEPACGEANFLVHAGKHLRSLGAQQETIGKQLFATEMYEPFVKAAMDSLSNEGLSAHIETGNFFDTYPMPVYDAVIGNPPYIRYQHFSGNARAKSLAVALKYGVRLSGLASSWAAFVIYASQFLKPEGRLGLVLPAELLSVKYAAQVRRFLLNRFTKVQIITFEELVFPGVLEDVVLLLAEGDGTCDKFELFQARNTRDLLHLCTHSGLWTQFKPGEDDKWTTAFLSPIALSLLQEYENDHNFVQLANWGTTYLGAVTGNNKYFTLTQERFAHSGLHAHDVVKISPPGSKHLRGFSFTTQAWETMSHEGYACFLFYPHSDDLTNPSYRYIIEGETTHVHTAYKCRVRKPWWRVPLVPVPDLFLTYMDYERPRLVTNEAGVYHLNSLYGITLHDPSDTTAHALLPIASLNSLSLLSAELVGRSYGGGLLKLEPREADMLAMPAKSLLLRAEQSLLRLKPHLAVALRSAKLASAVAQVDNVLLEDHMGLTKGDITALREAREFLFSRRVNRGKVRHEKNT